MPAGRVALWIDLVCCECGFDGLEPRDVGLGEDVIGSGNRGLGFGKPVMRGSAAAMI